MGQVGTNAWDARIVLDGVSRMATAVRGISVLEASVCGIAA